MTNMRWLIWPRQYGKTHRVLEWWLEDPENRVVVTASEELARHHRRTLTVRHTVPDALSPRFQGYLRQNIMSWRSWENGQRGRRTQQVALDDCVKLILMKYVGTNHELQIISDAGRVEEPDDCIANQVENFNARNRHLLPEGYDPAE